MDNKVVCIDNKPNGSSYIMVDVPLTIGSSYIIQRVNLEIKKDTYIILDDGNSFKEYRKDRFVTEEEWIVLNRDNKLKDLGI